MSSALSRLVEQSSKLDVDLISVERVLEYVLRLDEEPIEETNAAELLDSWPSKGSLGFSNVNLRYSPQLPLLLKGVSFTVASGESVGVVGRTGSGKSSLIGCLLRLYECESGDISIDGLSTRNVALSELRQRVAVVMQDSILFAETVKRNLFLGTISEARATEALVGLGVASTLAEAAALLEKKVASNDWSAGKRQLICIARMVQATHSRRGDSIAGP
eukprot:462585-Prymnesium_polylepis.1